MGYSIIRVILGALFIFSGWSKSIDPVGVSYKIEEYISAFGFDFLSDLALPIAVVLCALELFIGIMLFFKLWQKTISYFTLAFMLFFTVVTLLIYFVPTLGIKECGCFGDAFVLTNGQTLYKNIFFLALAFIYARRNFISHVTSGNRFYYNTTFMSGRKRRQLKLLRFSIYLYVVAFALSVPLYSALYLPPYTHLPFDIGSKIVGVDDGKEEGVITKLVYRNIKSGEVRRFDVEDTTWQDDTVWSYVDTETVGGDTDGGFVANSISVYDGNRENVTEQVMGKDGYSFFVIAQDIEQIEYDDVQKLRNLNELYKNGKINFAVFTASPIDRSRGSLVNYGLTDVNIYNVDLTQLKSLLRSSKGVILVSEGVISGKWNFREKIFKNITYNDIQPLIEWARNTIVIYFIIYGLLIAIMMYLVFVYHFTRR